jgi:hypothetical protein
MKNDWATLYDSPRTPAIAAFIAAPAVWMAVRSPATMYSAYSSPSRPRLPFQTGFVKFFGAVVDWFASSPHG